MKILSLEKPCLHRPCVDSRYWLKRHICSIFSKRWTRGKWGYIACSKEQTLLQTPAFSDITYDFLHAQVCWSGIQLSYCYPNILFLWIYWGLVFSGVRKPTICLRNMLFSVLCLFGFCFMLLHTELLDTASNEKSWRTEVTSPCNTTHQPPGGTSVWVNYTAAGNRCLRRNRLLGAKGGAG